MASLAKTFPSLLLASLLTIGLNAQSDERDSLGRHMVSFGPYGGLLHEDVANTFTGTGIETGAALRADLDLGRSGKGLALGISSFRDFHLWREQEEKMMGVEDLTWGLHAGYFTHVQPFKWNPHIRGGLSKLRFEYRYDFAISRLSGMTGGSHALRAAFNHARPMSGRLWLDMGLFAMYKDQWPGIAAQGNQTLYIGLGGGLSLALMLRTGERAPFP